MNRSRMTCLLVGAVLALLFGGAPTRAADDLALRREALRQRAAFQVSGRVVDHEGTPLESVRLDLNVHRFDIESLRSPGEARSLELPAGRFDIREDDATALLLRATKPGYLDAHWQIHHRELPAPRKQGIVTNLVLVLERLDGAPAREPEILPVMTVSSQRCEAVCRLFPPGGEDNAPPRVDMRLVLEPAAGPADDRRWQATLHAGEGGGIQAAKQSEPFPRWHHAPEAGYRPSMALPMPRRHASVSFFLKTREGHYAKVHARVARRRGSGTYLFEVFEAAIQTDGSRVLALAPGSE